MSAAAGHPSQRSRIAERLAVIAGDQGTRAIGRLLGVAGTTVSRWEGDVYAWGFHAVDLAIRDDELWAAIVGYREGDVPPVGEAVRVRGDLFSILTSCTELMHEVAQALKDGNVDRREAARLLKMLRRIVALITERVIPDLEVLDA